MSSVFVFKVQNNVKEINCIWIFSVFFINTISGWFFYFLQISDWEKKTMFVLFNHSWFTDNVKLLYYSFPGSFHASCNRNDDADNDTK